MTGDLMPITGAVRPHVHLRISKFSQHFIDVLDLSMTPLDYFMQIWPDLTREDARKFLGRYGISGACQTQIMDHLSDGQKSRVVLAKMAKENPHILFLDEPTNHLDMESIDSLAKAINGFSGGMVLVSHDMRLISQVAKDIWMCDNRTVTRFVGEISDFKMHLRREMHKGGLIEGDSKLKDTTVSTKTLFVPLAASKSGPAYTEKIAPLIPAKTPVVKAKVETEEDSIMKARLELAEMAISKQRARQAAEASASTTQATTNSSTDVTTDEVDEEGGAGKVDEKALQKAKKKAEKEAAEAFKRKEEEEREQRRLERVKEIEEAKKIVEEQQRKQEEFLVAKALKEAAKKAEEDQNAKIVAEAIEKRKREREAKKKAEKEERIAMMETARREVEEKVLSDPWTQEQQVIFEKALLQYTPNIEKNERWTKIANAVGVKSKNQCIARYKYLKDFVRKTQKDKL
jgi:ABC-type multidrug transport system ATPase subunit